MSAVATSFLQVPPGRERPLPVRIGTTYVQPERFLGEGGYARVYVATAMQTGDQVAVKHLITDTDQAAVESVQREVQLMRTLHHKNIVQFLDAHITKLPSGGLEALICMELCPGSVVNMMNARMQQRFKESEILRLFTDVCEAVAFMHYQRPPIIHRDLKVENILVSRAGVFKLCDFGSCTTRSIAAGTMPRGVELESLCDELERETTLQYRSPEMCDLYKRRGLDEKCDIWALGVLLYKLCFFITPFETEGKLAILNCRYQFPPSHPYSAFLVGTIRLLLQEMPGDRPNIYTLLHRLCTQQAIPCPIENIYTEDGENVSNRGRSTTTTTKSGSEQQAMPSPPPPLPMRADLPVPDEGGTSCSNMRRGRAPRGSPQPSSAQMNSPAASSSAGSGSSATFFSDLDAASHLSGAELPKTLLPPASVTAAFTQSLQQQPPQPPPKSQTDLAAVFPTSAPPVKFVPTAAMVRDPFNDL